MGKMIENYSQQNPLVSICVISYNSFEFVLETLESAKTQTYQNIELIVSDDGSTDNTIELCKNWLAQNKERFVRTELITVEKNTGIPANCNRAVKAAEGEWIKLIAADDILLPDCISDNVSQVNINADIKIQFSKIHLFEFEENEMKMMEIWSGSERFFKSSADQQFKILLTGNDITTTCSSFILKELILELGFFDEEFKLIEDYPFWLKCTQTGNKIHYLDKLTVLYRQHQNSVSITVRNDNNKNLIEPVSHRNFELYNKYVYPHCIALFRWEKKYSHRVKTLFLDKPNNLYNRISLIFLTKYLNPFYYLLFIYFHLSSKSEFWMVKNNSINMILLKK